MSKMLLGCIIAGVIITFSGAANAQGFYDVDLNPKLHEALRKRLHKPVNIRELREEGAKPAEKGGIGFADGVSNERSQLLSPFEEYAAGILPREVSTAIRQFGYSLFKNGDDPYESDLTPEAVHASPEGELAFEGELRPDGRVSVRQALPTAALPDAREEHVRLEEDRRFSEFSPSQSVPVGPDYIIGPEDEIRIHLWGNVENFWSVTVNRDGMIFLPKAGGIVVAGLGLGELRVLLQRELSVYYRNFEIDVSLGRLKTIVVYVVGEAKRPGAYRLSSISTMLHALFAAGGPKKSGSLRRIELKRNGETLSTLDLYDLLLRGEKSSDMRLASEDVVFIPPVGPLAGIAGHVRRPGIYELKGPTDLVDLVEMAGGLTGIAFLSRVQVHRVKEGHSIEIIEADLGRLMESSGRALPVHDADVVKVFAAADLRKRVTVTGAVVHEGEFGVDPGRTRLSEVIERAGGLRRYASGEAELSRLVPTADGPAFQRIVIDLRETLRGYTAEDPVLEEDDHVLVRSVPDWHSQLFASLSGEVSFPGTYAIRKGEKLSSLLKRAGGFTVNACPRGAVFVRERVRELQQKRLDEMILRLERRLYSSGSANLSSSSGMEEARVRELEFAQKERFLEKLQEVEADGRVIVHLDHPENLRDTPDDLPLEDGDVLYIPPNPSTIQVLGAVYTPGTFVHRNDFDLSDYIARCGGLTEDADEDEVYVLKFDGSAAKPESDLYWSASRQAWLMGDRTLLEPGDVLIVPDRLERGPWLRHAKDIVQVLFQMATTAGVIFLAL